MSDIADKVPSEPRGAGPSYFLRRLRPPEAGVSWSLTTYAVAVLSCIALVAAAWGLALGLEDLLRLPNLLLIFVPVVLVIAVCFGFLPASLTSVLSILAVSFLTEPRYSFAVADVGYVWALLIFLAVSALTSSLAAQLRERAESIGRRNRLLEQLYDFSSELSAHMRSDQLARAGAVRIASILKSSTTVVIADCGALELVASSSPGVTLAAPERAAAEWSFTHGKAAGRGTGRCEDAAYSYYPLDSGKGPVGVLGLARDASSSSAEDARLIEALRDQLALGLDRAKLAEEKLQSETLAETEKLRTALLTSISHDLKTPLASVLGNVSSLRQYGHLYDEATRAEMLELAEFETRRLSRFVENLLYMTRLDAGALRPTLELIDPADVIGAALKRVEKRTMRHRIETEIATDLPMVRIDFVLAEHALVNLLDNSVKYSPDGSTIHIAATNEADRVRVTVADEGPGIPAGDLPRIFERFFRAGSTDHRRAGAGLGLAICKGFVEAMGGEIAAGNRADGPGAVFTIELKTPDGGP
jgi:two-component system sensor histidine kinase KdpD